MAYEDNFSTQADLYARFRPQYPKVLFKHIARLAPAKNRAWDCATGNGQAALGLTLHFREIIATDASQKQIDHAYQHERITYRVARAESSGIDPESIDVITVAQALHWFDHEPFYEEVDRVLKPGGIIAVWHYFQHRISREVDKVFRHYFKHTVGPYWSPRIKEVSSNYATLPFPFKEIDAPVFNGRSRWTMSDALGYMNSWSATQKYRETHGTEPTALILEDLRKAWGDPERIRRVRWPLYMRIGKKV